MLCTGSTDCTDPGPLRFARGLPGVRLRAVPCSSQFRPEANQTSKSADNPIPCATSTVALSVCGRSPLGRWDGHDASPGAETDVATWAHTVPLRERTLSAKSVAVCCLVRSCAPGAGGRVPE